MAKFVEFRIQQSVEFIYHHSVLLYDMLRVFSNNTYGAICHTKLRSFSLHWRHNDHDSVSNHQPHGCLLNCLFRRRSNQTSKLRVTGLCAGNSPGAVNSPHKWPVTRKMFPFDDVIMLVQHTGHRAYAALIPIYAGPLAVTLRWYIGSHLYGITGIWAWISNYFRCVMWDIITHICPSTVI